jgi:galactonate dehydratase
VGGWNPIRSGECHLSSTPGLGLDIDERVIARHPYKPCAFPSLWDRQWLANFTQNDKELAIQRG